MVNWSSIELPKELGGLGVGNIMYKNLVLLFKWWWRYSESGNVLWKRIVRSVYDLKSLKAYSENFRAAKHVLWSDLMKNDTMTSKIRSIVEEGIILSVGAGNSILLWQDKWCQPGPLKVVFARLFSISTQKDFFISQMGSWIKRSWAWNLEWRRALYDWEQEDVARLTQILEMNPPKHETTDGVLWMGAGNTSFLVKSINDNIYESSSPLIPIQSVKSIWQNHIPPRA